MSNTSEYDRLAHKIRQTPSVESNGAPDTKTLLHYGILAASSHNTQPWKVVIDANSITLRPDFDRRCPVVDPDDAHLFKSLGCAAENIVLASQAQGYIADVSMDNDGEKIRIDFKKSKSAGVTSLFAAIPNRQCTKTRYDGTALRADELKQLEQTGTSGGVRTILLTSGQELDTVAQYVSHGNEVQLSDPAFRKELISWIRFNPNDAIRTGDGLSNRTTGNPSLPKWLAKLLIGFVLTPKKQVKTDAEFIKSSSAIAVFVAQGNDRQSWVNAGRVYQRVALHATDLGICHAFINQPLEVSTLRPRFESWLNLQDEKALLMVRLGRAEPAPFSLRRSVDDVMA
ncbi:nitroreductase [Chitinispirillum alkaliphilum]|nr:nitroreductase [Chitinispirillum alkaliphilum]